MLSAQHHSTRRARSNSHSQEEESAAPLAVTHGPASPAPLSSAPHPATAGAATLDAEADQDNLKQCWICYSDELEDNSRPFIHACQCTLVAHEQCLLDWLSAQASTRQTHGPRCPVCAAPITVREQRNQLLHLYRRFRRKADQASMVAFVGGIAAGGWFAAAGYGAWAVKVYMGDQVAQALLLRHERGLPWRYWLNLPLIPFALILSRTPLIDSLLPFLPLTLVLSARPHAPSSLLLDPVGLDDLTVRYPPSPTLTLCLLPWLRLLYLRLRLRVFHAVLGHRKKYRGLAGVFEEAAEDDANTAEDADAEAAHGESVELLATLEVDVEERPAPAPPAAAATARRPPAAAAAFQQPPQENTTTARIRVGLGRLTSLVVGALLFPALSAAAGSALAWIATRRGNSAPLRALRALLGISSVLALRGAGSSHPSSAWLRTRPGGPSWWSHLAGSTTSALASAATVDPVWVRNTVGAALVLVVRDACELTAGILEQRRRRSRHVVEKPFRPGTTATTTTATMATATPPEVGGEQHDRDGESALAPSSSGGRNAQGREAVVHTLL